ncbi:hypothetical protein IFR05_011078 [Cadophora sp. M221]|nr:hypothetical protein IFR05_011078 [Cadophora sp. M221]
MPSAPTTTTTTTEDITLQSCSFKHRSVCTPSRTQLFVGESELLVRDMDFRLWNSTGADPSIFRELEISHESGWTWEVMSEIMEICSSLS